MQWVLSKLLCPPPAPKLIRARLFSKLKRQQKGAGWAVEAQDTSDRSTGRALELGRGTGRGGALEERGGGEGSAQPSVSRRPAVLTKANAVQSQ